jgi:hypothetical protein
MGSGTCRQGGGEALERVQQAPAWRRRLLYTRRGPSRCLSAPRRRQLAARPQQGEGEGRGGALRLSCVPHHLEGPHDLLQAGGQLGHLLRPADELPLQTRPSGRADQRAGPDAILDRAIATSRCHTCCGGLDARGARANGADCHRVCAPSCLPQRCRCEAAARAMAVPRAGQEQRGASEQQGTDVCVV